MQLTHYSDCLQDQCADFWWNLHRDLPYVHRPDGYDWPNGAEVTPGFFTHYLREALSDTHVEHWRGEVSDESIFVAVSDGRVAGVLISSISKEERAGSVLSGFVSGGPDGRRVAAGLLTAVLDRFRARGLRNAFAAPWTRAIEVNSPFHLALLDAGFAQDRCRWPEAGYEVFLGGTLEGFSLRPEVAATMARLYRVGIEVRSCETEECQHLQWHHSGEPIDTGEANVRFVALSEGLVVGIATAGTATQGAEAPPHARVWGEAIPLVIPEFRGRGIGKVLYHLGVDWLVQQGATCTFLATGTDNPARFIYASTPLPYWYTSVSGLRRRLGAR